METLTILAVAVGLAMDAFAVSIATGIQLGYTVKVRHTFRLAFFFGFFQFIMTVIGWFSGYSVGNIIETLDHWIAMALLGFIGGKMIFEALGKGTTSELPYDPTRGVTLLYLSIATSIDAFAVGISLGVLNAAIWYPSVIIGLVAAGFSIIGITLGRRIGILLSRKIEILGGIILIAIGLKIFIEHIMKNL